MCGKKIKIGAEVSIKGLIKAAFEYVSERCTNSESGGDRSALNGGNRSVIRGGEGSKFKGGKWAVFACEVWDDYELVDMKIAVVDGVKIKPGVWYRLGEGGEFEEVGE